MNISEQTVANFIKDNFRDMTVTEFLSQAYLEPFMLLVKEGKEIAAAQAYKEATNADLDVCHLATTLAIMLT